MDKGSKILLIIIILLFMLVVVASYYHFFMKGDFTVTKQIDCNPQTETCFVSDCESNDSECDPTAAYKKIEIPSKYAGNDYDSLSCASNSSYCKVITCNQDTVEAGEKCFK